MNAVVDRNRAPVVDQGVSAQVSLYPLREAVLGPSIDEALRVFREYGLEVEPGAMSSLITGGSTAVFSALEAAFKAVAARGYVVMTVTVSNGCPVAQLQHVGIPSAPSR